MPIVQPGTPITTKLGVSQDSTLGIIETNALNPIKVVNITNNQTVYTIWIYDDIASAHFLDSANTLIILFGQSQTHIVNMTSDTKYSFAPIAAT